MLWVDEQVLEIEPRPGEEGGVALEPEREAGRLVAREGEHHLGGGCRAEQRRVQLCLGGDALVREPLVLGEPPDAREDDGDVGGCRGPEREFGSLGGDDRSHDRVGGGRFVLDATVGNR